MFTLFQVSISLAQTSKQLYDIKSTVVDETTNEPLPYANVFNKQLAIGTATNIDGYFELPNNRVGDTIVISYLGFVQKVFIVQITHPKVLKLKPNSALLGEVVVTANDDYLYALVSKVKKNKKTKSRVSKTYFYLETKLFGEPVEIIESYYNGKYSNFGADELKIKKGRIGLKPSFGRYFSSTESSRLFSMQNVFLRSDLFPDNPLLFNRKRLKKKYKLKLNHTYVDKQSKVYVIDFNPREGGDDLFKGTVWIDQNKNRIIKITLNIQKSAKHPFLPIGFKSIGAVDMEITKSYKEIGGQLFIDNIDFNYDVVYTDRNGERIEANTTSFSKAYDYNEKFDLPLFEFSKGLHEDYRNITISDYDAFFWEGTKEFRFYDRLQKVGDFIKENHIEGNILYPKRKSSLQRLESPYVLWNKHRIKISQVPTSKLQEAAQTFSTQDLMTRGGVPGSFSGDRYHLDIKLYLDVNVIQDSLTFQLETVLDPIGTYYLFEISNTDLAFINMYFDLMEIQKRKLKKELVNLLKLSNPDIALITSLYLKHLDEFQKTSEEFVSEVNRGKNRKRMKEWSHDIYKILNVDNAKMFGLLDLDDAKE